jgi:Tol biopolymer transport system component
MRWFLVMVLGVSAAALALVWVSPVGATVPGENGVVAFVGSDALGDQQIYSIEPDGANLTQLTSFDSGLMTSYSLWNLSWSPDGRWLAFQFVGYGGYPLHYVLTLDGSEAPALPAGYDLVFSPDGHSILYRGVDLPATTRVHDLSQGSDTLVTTPPLDSDDGSYAWMPDGRSFVFARTSCGSPSFCGSGFYRMDVATGLETRLAYCQPSNVVDGLDISPTGEGIAFVSRKSTESFGQLWACDLGSGIVTPIHAPDAMPAVMLPPSFSPDGSYVAATWDTPTDGVPPEIGIVSLTDGSWTALAYGRSPSWQPINPYPMGLADPIQGEWHLRDASGTIDDFYFGDPGDVPFLGDWDCDGIDTPGLYRRTDGYVYLRNSNTQGTADIKYYFGDPGDIPLAGDFNADGCDTVSLYRPSSQTFYIINELGDSNGGLGAAEYFYVFGDPGDNPFVGDFDGDGIDTVGLHRTTTGLVYFRNSHTQGIADNQFTFGDPGDRFITHDWNHDGLDTPAVYRPGNTTHYFRFDNSQGNADAKYIWGQPGWIPVTGTFTTNPDRP